MMAALKKGGTGVIISGPPVEAMADIGPQDMVRNHKKIVGPYYESVSPHITLERIINFYKAGKLKIDTVIERVY